MRTVPLATATTAPATPAQGKLPARPPGPRSYGGCWDVWRRLHPCAASTSTPALRWAGASGGTVSTVRRLRDARLFAVKQFHPAQETEDTQMYLQRVRAELCIASEMHHCNVVETVEVLEEAGGVVKIVDFGAALSLPGRAQRDRAGAITPCENERPCESGKRSPCESGVPTPHGELGVHQPYYPNSNPQKRSSPNCQKAIPCCTGAIDPQKRASPNCITSGECVHGTSATAYCPSATAHCPSATAHCALPQHICDCFQLPEHKYGVHAPGPFPVAGTAAHRQGLRPLLRQNTAPHRIGHSRPGSSPPLPSTTALTPTARRAAQLLQDKWLRGVSECSDTQQHQDKWLRGLSECSDTQQHPHPHVQLPPGHRHIADLPGPGPGA